MIKILLIDCSRALEVGLSSYTRPTPSPRGTSGEVGLRVTHDLHHPPVGLLALATQIAKSDIGKYTDIKIIDSTVDYTSLEELDQLIIDSDPDIVGLRCLHKYTEQFHQASAMAKKTAK